MRKKLGAFDIINVIVIISLIFCWLFPFWYIFVISTSTPAAYTNDPYHLWFHSFTLESYKAAFISGLIPRALLNSIIVTVSGTALSLLLTIPCAYALADVEFRASKVFSIITVIPMLFTGGLIPYYLTVTNLHLTDTYLALFIPICVSSYNLLIAKSFMRTLDKSMKEAAFIDGANQLQIFSRIVVPLSKPLITALGVFYGVTFYNDYFTPMLFINTRSLYPIQMVLREMVINNNAMSMMANSVMASTVRQATMQFQMACVILGIVPILAVFPFVQRSFTSGIMLGAVKE